MTYEETKNYLWGVKKRLRYLRKRIDNLVDEYNRVEGNLMTKGICYDGDRVQTSADDPMAAAEIRKDEIKAELLKLDAERTRHITVTQSKINMLRSEDEKKILSKYFLDDIRIEDAAVELNWSRRNAFYLKNKGIHKLSRML